MTSSITITRRVDDQTEMVVHLEYSDATRALDGLDAALVDIDEAVAEMWARRAGEAKGREDEQGAAA